MRRPESIITEWYEEWSAGRERMDMSEIVEAAHDRFDGDDEFVSSVSHWGIEAIVPHAVRSFLGDKRSAAKRNPHARFPTPNEINASLDEKARKWRESILSTWTESIGHGRRVAIHAMTREELMIAASLREQRAERELVGAEILIALAENMQESATVGETYDPEEVAELLKTTNVSA